MSDHLDELRHALTDPIGPHLGDEKLAKMAAAEAANEDVDALFVAELAHLARCPDCADEYGELVTLSLTAVADMAAAAQAITPQQVFTDLLQQEVGEPAAAAVADIVAAFPLLLGQPPTTPEAFDAALAGTALTKKDRAVFEAARRHLTALAAYLRGVAAATWGRPLDVKATLSKQGQQLQFQPAAAPALPVLSSMETGDEWPILSRRVGYPVSWHVSTKARRHSATICTLTVQADRPGLADASGREITITYGEKKATAVTDANGTATFPDIPIAALPTLLLTIDTQTEESAS